MQGLLRDDLLGWLNRRRVVIGTPHISDWLQELLAMLTLTCTRLRDRTFCKIAQLLNILLLMLLLEGILLVLRLQLNDFIGESTFSLCRLLKETRHFETHN